jgi:hypothetical protein
MNFSKHPHEIIERLSVVGIASLVILLRIVAGLLIVAVLN